MPLICAHHAGRPCGPRSPAPNPDSNAGKSLADVLEDTKGNPLIGCAWHPSVGRAAVPGSQTEFGTVIEAWVAAGAHCPAP